MHGPSLRRIFQGGAIITIWPEKFPGRVQVSVQYDLTKWRRYCVQDGCARTFTGVLMSSETIITWEYNMETCKDRLK